MPSLPIIGIAHKAEGSQSLRALPNPLRCFSPALTWASLPQVERDKIGALAVEFAFATFVSGVAHYPADRLCDFAIRDEAELRAGQLLALIDETVEAALPAVFGEPGEDPAWAWREPEIWAPAPNCRRPELHSPDG